MKEKTIQMPERFVMDTYRLVCHLNDSDLVLTDTMRDLLKSIERQINAKVEARSRRESFTAYKIAAPGSAERETHRQDYIEKAGIPEGFKSSRETPDI